MSIFLRELPELVLRLLQKPLLLILDGLSRRNLLPRWPWLIYGYRYANRHCNQISKQQLAVVSRLRVHHDVVKTGMTSTGVLQCYTRDRLFALPCGDVAINALAKSHEHWRQLQDSSCSALVAYGFTQEECPYLYAMELLHAIDTPGAVARVLPLMKGQHSEPICSFAWQPLIQRLASFVDTQALARLCESRTEVIFGPIHGDLHPGNVMANHEGQPVLIDLDRFHGYAPQFVDDIHSALFYMEQRARCSWLVLLATQAVRALDFPTEQLLAYTAFRAAAETAWSPPGPRYRRRLQRCLAALAALDERRTTHPVN